MQYESRGATKKDAREKANAINYKYLVEDSVISLSDFLAVPKEDRIRAQEVNITILLPVGKTIFIDNSLKDVIYDIDNITNTHDSNMLGKKWVMLKEGLTCLDCNKIEGITTTQLDSLRKFDIRL